MTLCGWSAEQTNSLSVLARNQTKAWARDLRRDRKWARERESELEKGTQRRQLAKCDAEGQSTTDSWRDWSAWDMVQEQWGKTSQDESAFLVALWKFHEGCTSALVYRCTGNAVSRNHPSCTLSWPKPTWFVCSLFFFSQSLGCTSCGLKEMCDTHIGTPRWIIGQERIVQRSW